MCSRPLGADTNVARTHAAGDLQQPFDAAVVVTTTLRPTLAQAVRSIFEQDLAERVQILVGIDRRDGDSARIEALAAECPERMALTIVDPGYSTARTNGGVHASRNGGALRSILSLLANSRHVAYLDDDNWYAPDHLSSLRRAIDGVGWAWTQRWFVDAATDAPIAVDAWDSVGPDAGVFARLMGGLVDANCLMIDTRRCLDVLWRWSQGAARDDAWDDRFVFEALRELEPGQGTGRPTVHYRLDRTRHVALAARIATAPPQPPRRRRMDLAVVMRRLHPVSPYAHLPAAEAGGEGASIHDGYRAVLRHVAARSVLDAGAGDGRTTIALARAGRDAGLDPLVVAIESWRPGVDLGLRNPAGTSFAGAYEAFLRRIVDAGCASSVVPLASAPPDAARGLARLGVVVDAVRVARLSGLAEETALHDLIRLFWPLVRPGGVLFVDRYKPRMALARRGVAAFAEPRGLALRLAGTGEQRVFALIKPAQDACPV
ncbi:MAG: glycosyltransferase family A protein [Alphaproteobacteria bacterium]